MQRTRLSGDQWRALREGLADGCANLHQAIEVIAVQDVANLVEGPTLQVLSRGLEVMGKWAFVCNNLRLGQPSPTDSDLKKVGHDINVLFGRLSKQVQLFPDSTRYEVPCLSADPTIKSILKLALEFAKGGRYGDIAGFLGAKQGIPTSLVWNLSVQVLTLAEPGVPAWATPTTVWQPSCTCGVDT